MKPSIILTAGIFSLSYARNQPVPFSTSTTTSINSVVTPVPCQRLKHEPCELETQERFNQFAYAFIYEKNLTKAFEYIAADYINHNPFAKNGSAAALDLLGPVWGNATITPIRTRFQGKTGWLNYNVSGFGSETVDRFRWERGCIAEHWDQGEVYPSCRRKREL
ncbi:hypothetical protein FGADI_10164 [Fusarium gaditjirri]|uniref:Uncharacterized protein n=1 Tax=Fusarium gaditjirri TaxID=282569 RepID=A0A8H4SY50_9HYPO|nr:hypothetical protein FGADI_10164 [Fusarium gaditjirri]